MKIPHAIKSLIESFEKLPGIGPKTAQRLTFYLLHIPQHELDKFSHSLQNLKKGTTVCSICFSVDETNPCSICSDPLRNKSIICVVEEPLDVLALEKNGKYKGIYHVLHGKIDPLNNIGPDEIYIGYLLERVKAASAKDSGPLRQSFSEASKLTEIIIATNPTMEGEATAMYIYKQLKSQSASWRTKVKITRIGRGLPVGADIEYADDITLERAMEGRSEID